MVIRMGNGRPDQKGSGYSGSARELYQALRRQPSFNWFNFLHAYVYARWIYFYIATGKGRTWLGKAASGVARLLGKASDTPPARPDGWGTRGTPRMSFADTYHAKVLPVQTARELISIKQPIAASLPEQVIPFHTARDIILQDPDHLVAFNCPCRMASDNPCLPMDVCLVVGEPFASFMVAHHAGNARWINQQEALEIIESEHQRGHVQHAFFKDVLMQRYYAICNCCSCCCAAIGAHKHGTPMLASSGYLARVDELACIGCGICVETCQFDALTLSDSSIIEINMGHCMGCGVCVSHCPQGALALELSPAKGTPLDIRQLTGSQG